MHISNRDAQKSIQTEIKNLDQASPQLMNKVHAYLVDFFSILRRGEREVVNGVQFAFLHFCTPVYY